MYSDINLGQVRVVYAGTAWGNMDTRFEAKDKVMLRRDHLQRMFFGRPIVNIHASGGDKLVDLMKVKLTGDWTSVECDGLISDNPELCLTLFPADCIPLIIY